MSLRIFGINGQWAVVLPTLVVFPTNMAFSHNYIASFVLSPDPLIVIFESWEVENGGYPVDLAIPSSDFIKKDKPIGIGEIFTFLGVFFYSSL